MPDILTNRHIWNIIKAQKAMAPEYLKGTNAPLPFFITEIPKGEGEYGKIHTETPWTASVVAVHCKRAGVCFREAIQHRSGRGYPRRKADFAGDYPGYQRKIQPGQAAVSAVLSVDRRAVSRRSGA